MFPLYAKISLDVYSIDEICLAHHQKSINVFPKMSFILGNYLIEVASQISVHT